MQESSNTNNTDNNRLMMLQGSAKLASAVSFPVFWALGAAFNVAIAVPLHHLTCPLYYPQNYFSYPITDDNDDNLDAYEAMINAFIGKCVFAATVVFAILLLASVVAFPPAGAAAILAVGVGLCVLSAYQSGAFKSKVTFNSEDSSKEEKSYTAFGEMGDAITAFHDFPTKLASKHIFAASGIKSAVVQGDESLPRLLKNPVYKDAVLANIEELLENAMVANNEDNYDAVLGQFLNGKPFNEANYNAVFDEFSANPEFIDFIAGQIRSAVDKGKDQKVKVLAKNLPIPSGPGDVTSIVGVLAYLVLNHNPIEQAKYQFALMKAVLDLGHGEDELVNAICQSKAASSALCRCGESLLEIAIKENNRALLSTLSKVYFSEKFYNHILDTPSNKSREKLLLNCIKYLVQYPDLDLLGNIVKTDVYTNKRGYNVGPTFLLLSKQQAIDLLKSAVDTKNPEILKTLGQRIFESLNTAKPGTDEFKSLVKILKYNRENQEMLDVLLSIPAVEKVNNDHSQLEAVLGSYGRKDELLKLLIAQPHLKQHFVDHFVDHLEEFIAPAALKNKPQDEFMGDRGNFSDSGLHSEDSESDSGASHTPQSKH